MLEMPTPSTSWQACTRSTGLNRWMTGLSSTGSRQAARQGHFDSQMSMGIVMTRRFQEDPEDTQAVLEGYAWTNIAAIASSSRAASLTLEAQEQRDYMENYLMTPEQISGAQETSREIFQEISAQEGP